MYFYPLIIVMQKKQDPKRGVTIKHFKTVILLINIGEG
jgi:hypothetical protein